MTRRDSSKRKSAKRQLFGGTGLGETKSVKRGFIGETGFVETEIGKTRINRVRGGIFARVGNFAIGGYCSHSENLAMQRILPETIREYDVNACFRHSNVFRGSF